jgi:hypothetical protein
VGIKTYTFILSLKQMNNHKLSKRDVGLQQRATSQFAQLSTPAQFLLKYRKLHQSFGGVEFPSFQQDENSSWNSLVLGATK